MNAILVALVLAGACAAGQLRVVVRDPSGASIAGAEVRAGDAMERTNASGEALFPDLGPGRLRVAIAADGFTSYSTQVTIKPAGVVTVERTLPLAPRTDQVDVSMDPREAAIANFGVTELSEREIELLPDDVEEMERILRDMAGPGAVFRVNGFRGGRLPHKSQIRSIRFRLTPYSAEEHDDGFMLVDITTKAGLGMWHGDAAFAFGGDALNARNAFSPVREPMQSRRLDFNLNGPLVREKTSLALQFSRNSGYDSRISNGLLPEGPFSRLIRLPNLNTLALGRVQHGVGKQSLTGEYQFERVERANAGPFDLPERAAESGRDQHQVRIGLQGALTARLFHETRFQAQWLDSANAALFPSPAVIVQGAFAAGGSTADSGRITRAFEWTDNLSFNRGKHNLRAGFQYDHLRHRGRDFTNGLGTTVYPSLAAFLAGRPALESRRSAEVTVRYAQNRGAVFLQDDIRVRTNLSVSLGLRQEFMSQTAGWWNPAPRAGFAWSPLKGGKTTLRGGGGIYNVWYEPDLYEETLRLNGGAQADLITSPSGARLPGLIRPSAALHMPYVARFSFGLQQQLPGRMNVMADYRHERGVNLFRSRDVNTPGSGLGYLLQLENGARSTMQGLRLSLGLMPAPESKGWRGQVFAHGFYFTGRMHDEVTSPLTPPADSRNARADWGPAAMDIRHRAGGMLQLTLPRGLQLGSFLSATSAPPYNVTTGADNNGDTFFTDRPAGETRNRRRGAAQLNWSGRVSWSTAFGKRGGEAQPTMIRVRMGDGGMPDTGMGRTRPDAAVRMQIYAMAANLLNRTNPQGFVGVATSPLFGQPLLAAAPRRIELGIRFGF